MNQITFTVKGTPLALERARHGKGNVYDTARNKNAKQAVAWEGKAAMGNRKPLQGPVRLSVAFLFNWPVSYSKKRRHMCHGNMKDTKPDLSNLIKLIEDALNGIAWVDDSQICSHRTDKFFSQTEACARIKIEPLWEQN